MPTLGFLKKKRTKDLPGPNDPTSPTSPTSETTSPIFATNSRPFDSSIDRVATNSSVKKEQPAQQSTQSSTPQKSAEPGTEEKPVSTGESADMAQAIPQQQYQSNIHGMGNQHDGAGQSANRNQGQHDTSAQPAQQTVVRQTKGKYSLGDFEIQRTLGTGSFGRVHLVQSKHNQRFYAVKVLKKQQVVKMKQVEHTNDERKMLQEVKHPFLITLWGTFQDSKNLYMVMDFVEGGELFSLLRKSQVWLQSLKFSPVY